MVKIRLLALLGQHDAGHSSPPPPARLCKSDGTNICTQCGAGTGLARQQARLSGHSRHPESWDHQSLVAALAVVHGYVCRGIPSAGRCCGRLDCHFENSSSRTFTLVLVQYVNKVAILQLTRAEGGQDCNRKL